MENRTKSSKKLSLEKIKSSEKAVWLLAIVINAVLFGVLLSTHRVYFQTNDDPDVLITFSGMWLDGTPNPNHAFSNIIWGWLVTSLYRMIPGVQWYSVLMLAAMIFSGIAICKCIFTVCFSRQLGGWVLPLLVYVSYFALVLMKLTVNLQFTCAASFLVLAACAIIFSSGRMTSSKKIYTVDWVVSFIAIILGYCIRDMAVIEILPFFVLVAGFRFFEYWLLEHFSWKELWPILIKIVCFLIAVVCVCGLAQVVDRAEKDRLENPSFREFDDYRSRFMDFPHPDYDEATEFYNSLGWDILRFRMITQWYFMDDRLSTETFKAAAEFSEEYGRPDVISDPLYVGMLDDGFYIHQEPTVKHMLRGIVVCMIALAAFAVTAAYEKEPLRGFGFSALAIVAAVGFALIFVFLKQEGRVLYRVVVSPLAAAYLINLLCVLELWPKEHRGRLRLMCFGAELLVAAALLYTVRIGIAVTYRRVSLTNARKIEQMRNVMDEYAMDHPENLYIFSSTLSDDNRTFLYGEKAAPNTMMWGGTYWHSKEYYDKINAFGISEMYTQELMRDNVYLFMSPLESELPYVREYLRTVTNGDLILVESLPYDVEVWKCVPPEEEKT